MVFIQINLYELCVFLPILHAPILLDLKTGEEVKKGLHELMRDRRLRYPRRIGE